MRRTRAGAFLLLPLVLTAIPLSAAAPAWAGVALEVPTTVAAGQVIELRWRGLPVDVEEVELLLSLDGGRSFHVRLTEELDGHVESYRWLVPDLPTASARLMLRMGDGAGERVAAISREFRIVHTEGSPEPDLRFHEGLMWTGLEPFRDPEAAIGPGTPTLADATEDPPGTLPTPAPSSAPLALGRVRVIRGASSSTLGLPIGPATPRDVPLRN
jgi:hypothetical protein